MVTLDDIVAFKREELEEVKSSIPLSQLEASINGLPPALDFALALRGNGIQLIAEVKKASPSAGTLKDDLDPVATARTYAAGGAAAISVLTESRFFLGHLDHMKSIRESRDNGWFDGRRPPLLRKDFVFDPYQVYEARAYGADAVLLIVAILGAKDLKELLALTHDLGMEALVEVHEEGEAQTALETDAWVIGINNRNLKTFRVDLETTRRLRPLIPRDRVVVSESGIRGSADVARLKEWGADAMLIGEALVTAPDVGAKIRELLGQ
ncbi:MAG: trpC [Dehalococcoidia bacterium]|nr:trpC [Dehalococcoidia bacterium]